MIENAHWSDDTHCEIIATIDGRTVQIPADPGNRHYQDIARLGITIAPPRAS